jgi:uncharacterized protein (TIGR02217 family)
MSASLCCCCRLRSAAPIWRSSTCCAPRAASLTRSPFPSLAAVTVERGLRAALLIGGAYLIAWFLGLDVAAMTMSDTLATRVLRGVINAVVILLLADFAWHLARAWIDRRLADASAGGTAGGPEFATTVVATGSGHEKRNVNWAEARGRWDVASGLKKQAQIDELIAFFRARRGKAYGFRFKDWTDYKASDQLLGTGDGALTFQLLNHYPSGSVIEVRTITKPVAGTVRIYKDSVEQLSGWSVDTTTGLVTFSTAPALGVEVTADFEFDVAVRFDTDHMR